MSNSRLMRHLIIQVEHTLRVLVFQTSRSIFTIFTTTTEKVTFLSRTFNSILFLHRVVNIQDFLDFKGVFTP